MKIYVFPGLASPPHECHYHLVAEDGEELYMTSVIPEHFAKEWLLKDLSRDLYAGAACRKKYPGGYELEYVRDWKTIPVIVELARVVK